MHGRGCAKQGGMHGRGCMEGGRVWQRGHVLQEKRQLRRAVHILLECILVLLSLISVNSVKTLRENLAGTFDLGVNCWN